VTSLFLAQPTRTGKFPVDSCHQYAYYHKHEHLPDRKRCPERHDADVPLAVVGKIPAMAFRAWLAQRIRHGKQTVA
jgi:hypothetical protein